jgi:hypothetical protein
MIFRGENHRAAFKIKFSRQNFLRLSLTVLFPMEFHHAVDADAAFVSQLRRDLSDEFGWDFYFRAPAGAFVEGHGAKLAIVWLAA